MYAGSQDYTPSKGRGFVFHVLGRLLHALRSHLSLQNASWGWGGETGPFSWCHGSRGMEYSGWMCGTKKKTPKVGPLCNWLYRKKVTIDSMTFGCEYMHTWSGVAWCTAPKKNSHQKKCSNSQPPSNLSVKKGAIASMTFGVYTSTRGGVWLGVRLKTKLQQSACFVIVCRERHYRFHDVWMWIYPHVEWCGWVFGKTKTFSSQPAS